MNALLIAFGTLAGMVALGVGAAIASHHRTSAREAAEAAARALNLELRHPRRGIAALSGVVDGRRVVALLGSVNMRVDVHGVAHAARLAFKAEASDPNQERTRAAFARDIEVGDVEIDDYWKIEGRHEGVVRALFSRREVQRYLVIWSELALTPEGKLSLRRYAEPGPNVTAAVRHALELAALLEGLADIEPLEVEEVKEAMPALLESRGIGGSSGAPVPVPSLAPPKRKLFRLTRE